MEAHKRYDADLVCDAGFVAWVGQLEAAIADFDKRTGVVLYGAPLSETTGLECWHDMYVDGMTPQQALEEDLKHWD